MPSIRDRVRKAAVTLAALTVGRSVRLRALLLWGARSAGRMRIRLSTGWPGLVFLYLFAALLVGFHGYLVKAVPLVSPPAPVHWLRLLTYNARPVAIWFLHGTTGPWMQAVALAALIAAIRSAAAMRKRIVILSFANLSGDDKQKDFVNALPRRLMTELAEIGDIHTQLRDDPGNLSLDSGPAPRLEVDPTSSATSGLKGALTGVKIPIGPLSIPLDGAVTVLSTLLRGPQIVGSLQCTSETLLIEASLSGGARSSTWRVTAEDADKNRTRDETGVGVMDLMVRQLAYRIFTHLNAQHLGTFSWRAVGHYTEGLRAVREATHERGLTTRRVLALQRAQQEFFAAFREDARFVRSRYNLGVILFSQRRWQPACEVFQAVVNDIEGDPLPSAPGTPAYQRARHDLASAHFAAASAFFAQAREFEDQQRVNEEWCDRAEFQAAKIEKAATDTLEDLKKALLPAPERPILAELEQRVGQVRAPHGSSTRERSARVLQQLRRARLLIESEALDRCIARQEQLVQLDRAGSLRDQVRAVRARTYERGVPEKRTVWVLQMVDYHADMALRLDPAGANSWNLKGERALPGADACGYFRRASALIWMQLCLAEWTNGPTPALLLQAVNFLANLAQSHPESGSAVGEIDQVLSLDPSNAVNWVIRGKLCLIAGRYDDALESFRDANRERELGLHWLWIACTLRAMALRGGGDRWRRMERDARRRAIGGCAGVSLFPAPPFGGSRYPAVPPDVNDLPSPIYRDGRFELFQPELEKVANRMRKLTNLEKGELRAWCHREVCRMQWLQWSIEVRRATFVNLAWQMTAQVPAGVAFSPAKLWKRRLPWIERSYRTDVAARESLVDATTQFLGIFNKDRFAIRPEEFEQAVGLVSKAMEVGPIEANQRMLLAHFYFLTGLPDQSQEEITNALNIRPDGNFEAGLIRAALRRFHDITDKRIRSEALRRIVAVCKDLADREAYDLSSRPRLDNWGIWHYYLGCFSLDTLDYQTAQRCFATCFDRRQFPIESLQLLCYAFFRCGAFEAGEEAYQNITNLFCQLLPPGWQVDSSGKPVDPEDLLEKMTALQTTEDFNDLGKWTEQLAPAWNRAMAANHTAAAMAEQGLTEAASQRWKVSKKWGDSLARQPDRKLLLQAAQYLCQGVILLNAASSDGPVDDPDPANPPEPPAPPPPPSPLAVAASQAGVSKAAPPAQEGAPGGGTTAPAPGLRPTEEMPPAGLPANVAASPASEDPRVTQLRKAIRCFTISIGYAADPANRADANFRIGIACDALARLDSANADAWKGRGRRALRNVVEADRRDEYKERIGPLMKKLGGQFDDQGPSVQAPDSSSANARTVSAPARSAQEGAARRP